MKRLTILLLAGLLLPLAPSSLPLYSCTNLIVGKKASKDGSVIISYSQDDYGSFEPLRVIPAADHPAGSMHPLYHYESNNYLGEIPEVAHTYGIVGLMNEFQVSIHETTWGGGQLLYYCQKIYFCRQIGKKLFFSYYVHKLMKQYYS